MGNRADGLKMKLPALQPTPENIAIYNELREKIKAETYLDKFVPKWKPVKGVHDKAQIIKNTFEMFKCIFEKFWDGIDAVIEQASRNNESKASRKI